MRPNKVYVFSDDATHAAPELRLIRGTGMCPENPHGQSIAFSPDVINRADD